MVKYKTNKVDNRRGPCFKYISIGLSFGDGQTGKMQCKVMKDCRGTTIQVVARNAKSKLC